IQAGTHQTIVAVHPVDVKKGSVERLAHVSFTPKNGHPQGRHVMSVWCQRQTHGSQQGGYPITSSARASTVGGKSRPSVLAVPRLTTSSNLVGCSTGRSAGLAPLRMRSTKYAARRYKARMFAP